MSAAACALLRDTFVDSVLLMSATRAMVEGEGVEWATAVMATPANVSALISEGVPATALEGASANDLALAVRADSEAVARAVLDRGRDALFAERPAQPATGERAAARTVEEAVAAIPGANVAIVSVTGEYAALAAHHALTAGLHVLLFSDHVTLEEEVELKDRAASLGRLVMGPGAGTAILGGTGLGFANVVGPGRVGVVAAAGTGAQEVSSLLDRWGAGVSQVIGIGGRDLSAAVGGRMARVAIEALDADRGTDAILLVSKPPAQADGLPAPAGSHVCLDLGEEEYTQGRPHPMIDPEARLALLREQGADPATAVVLLDVVLGHGSHPDPAGVLAPACAELSADPEGPRVVAYVLGTRDDPQGYGRQRAILEEVGCIVTATAARAAHAAAAIALRRPELAAADPG